MNLADIKTLLLDASKDNHWDAAVGLSKYKCEVRVPTSKVAVECQAWVDRNALNDKVNIVVIREIRARY